MNVRVNCQTHKTLYYMTYHNMWWVNVYTVKKKHCVICNLMTFFVNYFVGQTTHLWLFQTYLRQTLGEDFFIFFKRHIEGEPHALMNNKKILIYDNLTLKRYSMEIFTAVPSVDCKESNQNHLPFYGRLVLNWEKYFIITKKFSLS